jgi:membrane protease subunit (stomatin/prohibitin family)
MEYDQSARIAQLEQQQQMQQMQQAPAAPAAAPQSDMAAKLTELKGLLDQGVLTEDEFTAAKQKLLAG